MLANREIEVKEVTPYNAAKLATLVFPQLGKISSNIFIAEPQEFLMKLFRELTNIADMPGLMLQVYCCLVDVEYDWLVKNVSAFEIIQSLTIVNMVNRNVISLIYEMIFSLIPLVEHVKPAK